MTMTGKPLIESDRVEGTTVYDPEGNSIGTIKRLMIEKIGGRVAYAVMTFGGFLGLGEEEHANPWNALTNTMVHPTTGAFDRKSAACTTSLASKPCRSR
jgi:hypothetical protein